jgi:hypothetical protein
VPVTQGSSIGPRRASDRKVGSIPVGYRQQDYYYYLSDPVYIYLLQRCYFSFCVSLLHLKCLDARATVQVTGTFFLHMCLSGRLRMAAVSPEKVCMPPKLLKDLETAGAVILHCGGFPVITAEFGSAAWEKYAEWVRCISERESDPSVGCIVAPSQAIASSTIAPPMALFGPIQVMNFVQRCFTLRAPYHCPSRS